MTARIDDAVARLGALHPVLIDLSLDRLAVLLAKLGHPELRLPPVIHVAGTNGKGSTCAFLRAIAEASGLRPHVYTSPHLVRFNERIRLAGSLVQDDDLADALEETERVNAGAAITVFEVTTAAAFLLFARVPADLCILEVGLGGRFDATNVIESPAACAITSISLDHKEFLGQDLPSIAREKAGILKAGAPAVTGSQDAGALAVLDARAAELGVRLQARHRDWQIEAAADGLCFSDASGRLGVPKPALQGAFQFDNAGIAIAAMRAAIAPLPKEALAAGIASATWPGRLQRLAGRLAGLLSGPGELWLDGGHNPGAGTALAAHLRGWADRPVHLVVGMRQAKDVEEFLRPLLPCATTVWACVEPGQYLALPVAAIIAASGGVATAGPTVADALRAISSRYPAGADPGRVLVCGSLYLAGEVLKADQARLL